LVDSARAPAIGGEDLLGTRMLPNPGAAPVSGIDPAASPNVPRAPPNAIADRLPDPELAPGTVKVFVPGEEDPRDLAIGKFLGRGSFNAAFRSAEDAKKVIRISRFPSDHPYIQFDRFGREALEELKPLIGDVLEFPEGEVLNNVESLAWDGLRTVSIVDFYDGPRAIDLFRANPGGVPTPGQAIAYDRAVRSLNLFGYALIDGHPYNFTFRRLAGDDAWRMVLLDPGGIVKVPDPAAARRVQSLVDAPPEDDVLRKLRQGNPEEYRKGRTQDIVAELAKVGDLDGTGFDDFSQIIFDPTGMESFDSVRALSAIETLDPDEIDDAYAAIRGGSAPAD
jgi:hypothetical protein